MTSKTRCSDCKYFVVVLYFYFSSFLLPKTGTHPDLAVVLIHNSTWCFLEVTPQVVRLVHLVMVLTEICIFLVVLLAYMFCMYVTFSRRQPLCVISRKIFFGIHTCVLQEPNFCCSIHASFLVIVHYSVLELTPLCSAFLWLVCGRNHLWHQIVDMSGSKSRALESTLGTCGSSGF